MVKLYVINKTVIFPLYLTLPEIWNSWVSSKFIKWDRKVISLTGTKVSKNFWDLKKGRLHLNLLGKICDKPLVWVSQPCFILKVQSEILYMFQISSVQSLSRVRLFATPWTAAYQAPQPMRFSKQEYWSGVPLPSPYWKPKSFKFLEKSEREKI